MKRLLKRLAYGVIGLFALFYFVLSMGLTLAGRISETVPEGTVEGRSKEPHTIELIDSGLHSLKKRLQLIESAKKSIDLEFFIYNIDQSSRLLTQALARQAGRGVKIRILVDFSTPIFQLKPAYAHFLKQHGIEVRYYNTTALYRIVSAQHRSHRKLFIIDGERMITGGRNIADEYFDLGGGYNFLDSDIEIHGPIVRAATKSFDLYWDSTLSAQSSAAEEGLVEAARFLQESESDRSTLAAVGRFEPGVPRVHRCGDVEYVSDLPGRSDASRKVFQAIVRVLAEAKTKVLAESPYFVVREGGMEVMRDLQKRSIATTVLTNGLGSTDATYVVSSLFLGRNKLAKTGIDLYVYGGDPLLGQGSGRWGIHAKRGVIDDRTSIIGTYNIDPRSANLNSELIVICRDSPELAAEMRANIEQRIGQAHLVLKAGQVESTGNIFAGSSWGQRTGFALMLPIAHLFDFIL